MINTLLTIIIPCKNSIIGTKKTIEDLSKKTKIRGTKILALDFGSVDGTYQYIAQASSEMSKILKIESVKMEDDENIKDIIDSVDTPYVLVINPGSTFKDDDFILSSLNKIPNTKEPLVYLGRYSLFNSIISAFIKNKRKINGVFYTKDLLKNIEFVDEDQEYGISLDKQILSIGIKIEGFTDN